MSALPFEFPQVFHRHRGGYAERLRTKAATVSAVLTLAAFFVFREVGMI
jgi:hypothetical protein